MLTSEEKVKYKKEYLKDYHKKYYLENKEKLKEQQREYSKSSKGRECKKRYRKSLQGKESRKRYKKSQKGRENQKRYRESSNGKKRIKENGRKYHLKQTYNLKIEEYNKMFNEQNGCCAICGVHQNELTQKLNVDHDHKSGIVRGLLCNCCNSGLGYFKESIKNLVKAKQYLKNGNYIIKNVKNSGGGGAK
jgi:hypothetical protein